MIQPGVVAPSAAAQNAVRPLPRTVAIAVAAPTLLATLFAATFAVLETAGRAPLVGDAPQNVAEAAALGMGAELLRMLRRGDDPTRLFPVHPDIISAEITQVTALEAAIWSRRAQIVRLLDREGAIRGEAAKRHMACVAVALEVDDIIEYLYPHGVPACDPEQVIRAIRQRTE